MHQHSDLIHPGYHPGPADQEGLQVLVGDLNDPQAYRRLMDELSKPRMGVCENIVFYLAIKPSDFLAVIEQLDPDSLSLGGHRAEITTVFADLRGFTAFSEGLDAEVLVTVLNRYLAAAAEAILARARQEAGKALQEIQHEKPLIEEVGRIHGYEQIPEDVGVPMVASTRTRSRSTP